METVELIDDVAAVRAVVMLYVEGSCGDAGKLRQAFHPVVN